MITEWLFFIVIMFGLCGSAVVSVFVYRTGADILKRINDFLEETKE